jgi:precorrin-6B methylase 2
MSSTFLRAAAVALILGMAGAQASAQTADAPAKPYEPSVGQPGKDVIWVPTPQILVDTMLDMAKLRKSDYLMDLGSGDGRLVITAAKRGARALGVEYNPAMVELSQQNAKREGLEARARFVEADIFKTDFSEATVITMFLLPAINLKLRPTILALKPGTRIVSNSFDMGDWEPDRRVQLTKEQGCDNYCTAFLWIVPAQVGGVHKVSRGELTLKQTFQQVSGSLRTNDGTIPVQGTVVGDELRLTAAGRPWRGKVRNGRVEMQ